MEYEHENDAIQEELEFLKLVPKLAKEIVIYHFLTYDSIEFFLSEAKITWSLNNKKFGDLSSEYQELIAPIIKKANRIVGSVEHKW